MNGGHSEGSSSEGAGPSTLPFYTLATSQYIPSSSSRLSWQPDNHAGFRAPFIAVIRGDLSY